MLKSLQLFGFKSFADRTQFDFASGITCVVGPNGSGKSNVVDGIKWLLGDQSPKSLRGKEMTDVIFNGALGRKPSAFAEAVLTFDNSKGILPVDTPEVQIGRRLWQSGESEYLINGVTSRLKDVRDLFLGTGAGASAYSIIEQGRVDQILQANASTRRVVFEEAAGISRYKLRKVETLRKLERVSQNVLRLTDIVDEVEAQLNSAKTQATKALKYREVEEELRELWFGLAADDARSLTDQLSVVQEALHQDNAELELLNVRRQASERQLALVDQQISELDDRLHAVERRHSQNGQEIAREQSTIQHLQARDQDLRGDLARLKKQRNLLWTRMNEITALARKTAESFEEARNTIQQRADDVEQHANRQRDHLTQLTAMRRRGDELKELLFHSIQDKNRLQLQIAGLNRQIESASEAASKALEECTRCESQLAQSRSELDALASLVADRQRDAEELDVKLTQSRQRHRQLSQDYEAAQLRMSELREERSALHARKSILEDWENRQEGMGLGVKEILARSRTSPVPPWNQLLGSVADLFIVDLDHAAILEVSLGDRAQLLVMRELKPLIDYLNQNVSSINGRVGFIALDRIDASDDDHDSSNVSNPPTVHDAVTYIDRGEQSSEPISSIDLETDADVRQLDEYAASSDDHIPIDASETSSRLLSAYPGVVQRADHLMLEYLDPSCEATDDIKKLARFLLSDTWIVEKLDVAYKLADGPGRGFRFVTLQGERLEADGTLFVGLDRPETALVSRKSELRRLRNDLSRVESAMSDEEIRIAEFVATLDTIDSEAAQLHEQWQAANDAALAAKSSLNSQEQALLRLENEHAQWQDDRHNEETRLRQFSEELDESQTRLSETEEAIDLKQSEIDRQAESLKELERLSDELDQQLQQSRLILAKQEERLSALELNHARQQEEERQRREQLEEAERRLESTTDKIRQYSMQILHARARLAELYLERDETDRQKVQFHSEKGHLRQIRVAHQKDDHKIQQERRDLQDRKHEREMRARDIQYQITTLQQRIEEEYQLQLEEIVATGASALALYRAGKIRNISKPASVDTRSSVEHEVDSTTDADDAINEDEERDEEEIIAEDDEEWDDEESDESDFEDEDDEDVEYEDDDDDDDSLELEADDDPELLDPSETRDDELEDESANAASATDEEPTSELPFDAEQFAAIRDEVDAQVQRLRRKLKMMGNINPDSLHNLDELEKRYRQLRVQLDDLIAARSTLEEIIRRLNTESKRIFIETFETIRGHFRELFRKLFGGGEADIILEDPEDVLDCGIDIVARPPGKELRSITLMSGGEKTMTAVALLMSIFRSRPSPFCILDEVDAALDEANVERYVNVLREFDTATQFILITHNKRSMSAGSVLHGVTMEQSGISKRFSVRFEDVNDNGEFTKSPDDKTQAA